MSKRTRDTSFGAWLRREVENRELTFVEFAARVGVTKIAVSAWVNGHVLPKGINIVRIARVLDLPREAVEAHLPTHAAAA